MNKMMIMVLLLALGLVGCTGDSSTFPQPSDSGLDPTPRVEYEAVWSPAWDLPVDVGLELEAVLGRAATWLLIPTSAPNVPVESLSAEVHITEIPIGRSIDLNLLGQNQEVSVSVQITTSGDEPICQRYLNDMLSLSYPLWSQDSVRGLAGCSLETKEGVSFVAWTEQHQDFYVVSHEPAISAKGLIEWIETWGQLPST